MEQTIHLPPAFGTTRAFSQFQHIIPYPLIPLVLHAVENLTRPFFPQRILLPKSPGSGLVDVLPEMIKILSHRTRRLPLARVRRSRYFTWSN